MSYYMSHQFENANTPSDMKFVTLGSFKNLREGLHNNQVNIFLWEYFTTKPWFDNKELKHIGNVVTPWPAFSVVASSKGLSLQSPVSESLLRNQFLPALGEGAALFQNGRDESVQRIMSDFSHKEDDARAWLTNTK